MQVIQHRPAARGVSQLMYVGDAEYSARPSLIGLAIAAAASWLLLRSL